MEIVLIYLGTLFLPTFETGGILPLVNATTIKTAPKGAIDQLDHVLSCIIHALVKTDEDIIIFDGQVGHQGRFLAAR
jgi:hypothetical protein